MCDVLLWAMWVLISLDILPLLILDTVHDLLSRTGRHLTHPWATLALAHGRRGPIKICELTKHDEAAVKSSVLIVDQ
jgi:hypothetical protein